MWDWLNWVIKLGHFIFGNLEWKGRKRQVCVCVCVHPYARVHALILALFTTRGPHRPVPSLQAPGLCSLTPGLGVITHSDTA